MLKLPSKIDLAACGGRGRIQSWPLITLIFVYFVFVVLWGVYRHFTLLNSINDTGVFDQAVWGSLQGEWFLNTSNPFGVTMNWLGFHFHVILLVLVPLYAIVETPLWFVVAQGAAAAISIGGVYRLSQQMGCSYYSSVSWASVFAFNPFFFNAMLWDFHPVFLAVPLCVYAYWALLSRSLWFFWTVCVALLTVKESLGLMVAGFGLLWGIYHRDSKVGAGVFALGVIHFIVVIEILMPLFSPFEGHPMFTGDQGHLSRFYWLGEGVAEVVKTLVYSPFFVVNFTLFTLGGFNYLASLLLLLVFIPVFKLIFLLPIAGELVINLLSINGWQRSIYSYHSVLIVTGLVVATIAGGEYLRCRFKGVELLRKYHLSFVLLAIALLASTLSVVESPWEGRLPEDSVFKDINRINRIVGADSVVQAQGNLGGHFSARKQVYAFSGVRMPNQTYILHLYAPTSRVGVGVGDVGSLNHLLQMDVGEYLHSISCLMTSEVSVLYWKNNWLVLKTVGDSPEAVMDIVSVREAVNERLKALPLELGLRIHASGYGGDCGKWNGQVDG